MITRRESFLANSDLIPAAVLIPILVNSEGGGPGFTIKTRDGSISLPELAEVVLTVRANSVEHHKGQISFPGGVRESHDSSLEMTALRESQEEIGLDPGLVKVVGELPDVPTIATRFRVRPFIGIINGRPTLTANPAEISEILFIPMRHLLDPANSKQETFERDGLTLQMRTYYFGSHRIWGATGHMLQILLEKHISANQIT